MDMPDSRIPKPRYKPDAQASGSARKVFLRTRTTFNESTRFRFGLALRPISTTRRAGMMVMESICACGLVLAMFGLIAMTLHGIGTSRLALLRRTFAEQTLNNSIELIHSWPANADVEEQLAELTIPTWSAEQLPKAKLAATVAVNSLLPEAPPEGLQPIRVSIEWLDRPMGPPTRLECITWRRTK